MSSYNKITIKLDDEDKEIITKLKSDGINVHKLFKLFLHSSVDQPDDFNELAVHCHIVEDNSILL